MEVESETPFSLFCVCLKVPLAAMKLQVQSNLWRINNTVHPYTSTALLFIEGSQSRNPNSISLEVGADAEAMEKCCLLAYTLPAVCSVCFLIKPRTPSPWTVCLLGPGPQWAGPSPSVTKKRPYRHVYNQILRRHFLH